MQVVNRDYLTGLYNRQGMYEIWRDAIAKQEYVQIIFIDVDNFKSVNDMYGHKEGDKTLIKISEIICDNVRDKDAVIRLGGDELVIMQPGSSERESLKKLAHRIMGGMNEEAKHNHSFEIITLSMGIVCNAKVNHGIDALLSYSDAAMYFAKEQGKNQYVFFDEYEERIKLEAEMESTAGAALKDGKFDLLFYPVMHLQTSKLLRTVAMIVWNTSKGKKLIRSEFERVLSKNGLIRKIDIYAFRKLCNLLSLYDKKILREVRVCIQLSDILLDEDVVSILLGIMYENEIYPEEIEILVSETLFGNRNSERIIKNLIALKEAGFYLGLTDFGDDFSGFRYIENIPFSTVMFDRDYLGNNMEDDTRVRVLSTLFNLTKSLHLLSVGKGVDSLREVEFLIQNGCDGASGNYFSKLNKIEKYIKFISGITENKNVYKYAFENNLATIKGDHPGEIVGGGIEYIPGISDEWGALSFSGGPVDTNLVRFPESLLMKDSFTITMWIRPKEIQNWTSAIYVRHQNGFTSFMPSVDGNICMLRMHPDGDAPWTDNIANGLPLGRWTHVSMVYDAFSNTNRLFIDGLFVKMRNAIPEIGKASVFCLGGDCYQVSFRGDISALCVFDVPLSAEEIYDHYISYKSETNFHGDDESELPVDYVTHDPAIFEDSDKYYIYQTGGECLVSDDMYSWANIGKVVDAPEEAKQWTGSDAVWAPDIVKVDNEYRLYCSNSSWGVQKSCIFLAISDKPEGPFVPQGIVFKTDDTLNVNGIDANIVEDHETGEQYMLYGSFWGGIHILPLEKKTGYLKDAAENSVGICLARRPDWTSASIEGPYMIYMEETGYYYLFVSYGSLKNDYNIRVGRSKNITGPFLDYYGNDMADPIDENCSRGMMIAAGYRWITGMPYMAPGHNSVLKNENGETFLVSHIRKMQFLNEDIGPGLLQIRRLFCTPDQWLIAASQPYAKEKYRMVKSKSISGEYERIEFRPSMPQGISHAHPLRLYEDGRLECCSIVGEWRQLDEFSLELSYGVIKEYVHFEIGIDMDINIRTVIMSGLTSQGICTWAKKVIKKNSVVLYEHRDYSTKRV
ncbi:MAG: family 43 glycosylhydrolase [Eubacterium sp.]|nr:family 43 glycosylhydrolase [Eubacterium sp.]